jgi:septal ring factor EnvC (AmiA/AmiB activator)
MERQTQGRIVDVSDVNSLSMLEALLMLVTDQKALKSRLEALQAAALENQRQRDALAAEIAGYEPERAKMAAERAEFEKEFERLSDKRSLVITEQKKLETERSEFERTRERYRERLAFAEMKNLPPESELRGGSIVYQSGMTRDFRSGQDYRDGLRGEGKFHG